MKVGLNGFGRIGRAIARIASEKDFFELVAINTSKTTPAQLAYSLKYDSTYRTFNKPVKKVEDGISLSGRFIKAYNIRNPEEIPWEETGAEVIIDCTGVFKTREDLKKHLRGTVKKVILTVPAKDETIPHVVMGVNSDAFDWEGSDIISNASCTTNCAAVMMKILQDEFGVETSFISTIHAYTSSQMLVDNPADKFTRSRAAAVSIIPTTTGASDAVCKVTDLHADHMGGMAFRVPTPSGSITDITAILKKPVTVDEINAAFKKHAGSDLKNILDYAEDELVSADYIGASASCTFDPHYTAVLNGTFVKCYGWYDNEWGYSNRVVDVVGQLANVL
ncbi:type I glyceraldehyde-3-phosphate dehydrogenase [Candidatus Woesebacteria bacterium]|nr:type I glyceraldehyde-3-phosphate dehydrogenase [Candidatus Woesebacteria bacterium]